MEGSTGYWGGTVLFSNDGSLCRRGSRRKQSDVGGFDGNANVALATYAYLLRAATRGGAVRRYASFPRFFGATTHAHETIKPRFLPPPDSPGSMMPRPRVVVSLGTSVAPDEHVSSVNVFKPTSISEAANVVMGGASLGALLLDRVCHAFGARNGRNYRFSV